MKRTLAIIKSSKIRESLWYNLKRVWVEHRYDEELRELASLVDLDEFLQARGLVKKLRREDKSHYLEPELIRAETLMSFLSGGEN